MAYKSRYIICIFWNKYFFSQVILIIFLLKLDSTIIFYLFLYN